MEVNDLKVCLDMILQLFLHLLLRFNIDWNSASNINPGGLKMGTRLSELQESGTL
jgi:hypothetical protein